MLAMILAAHLLTTAPCSGQTTFACLAQPVDGCSTGEFCNNQLVRTWCIQGICGD